MTEYQTMKKILRATEEYDPQYHAEYYNDPTILQTCGFYYRGILFIFDKKTGNFQYATKDY